MREFKFRGFNGEKWLYGNLDIHYKTKQAAISDDRWWRHPVLFNTVGQFTGLKDFDDNEIYEGDIVRVVSYGNVSIHKVEYGEKWGCPAFDLVPFLGCDSNGLSYCMADLGTYVTVIGNIHDNPELLTKD